MNSQLPCLVCGKPVLIMFPPVKGAAKLKFRCQNCGTENLIRFSVLAAGQVPTPPSEPPKPVSAPPIPSPDPRPVVPAGGGNSPTLVHGNVPREPTLVRPGSYSTSLNGTIQVVESGKAGSVYSLKTGKQVVGRWSPGVDDCDIQVPVKDLTLSRRHFQIQVLRSPQGFYLYKISDLHSKNKTKLIGQSGELEIGTGSELYLSHGDIIVAGQTQFLFTDK